jgi:hypothetical protein
MVMVEVGVMFWIQVAAAVLLIIPSALIFQYLYWADRYDAEMRFAVSQEQEDRSSTLKHAA